MSHYESDCPTCGRSGAELPVRVTIIRNKEGDFDVISTWTHEDQAVAVAIAGRHSTPDVSMVEKLTFDEMLGHVALQTAPARDRRCRLFGDGRRLPTKAAQALIEKGVT